ncbi:anthranilate synthase component I family protein [Sphingobacterium hungaricum]
MATASFEVENPKEFLEKALFWANQFQDFAYYNSNNFDDVYSKLTSFLAVEALDSFQYDGEETFEKIEKFKTGYPNHWIPGFFSYDLKNEIEDLATRFPNYLDFPEAYFFIPKTTLSFAQNRVNIDSENPSIIFQEINAQLIPELRVPFSGAFEKRMSKKSYFEAFEHMQRHIQLGDIYEVNLCQEFFAEQTKINPIQTYLKLDELSPTPFSVLFKQQHNYIISATPERFLAKRGQKLISQPIKGTAKRGLTDTEDTNIKQALLHNPKEIAENLMIVDLVRNDLTKSAVLGTVQVERKLEVQSFQQVHQLVSTITCQLNPEITATQAIKNTFPAGSMTGAPKISAMELCEKYENSKRGIYSGAVGYFAPDGDFDFNVIIRSLVYNQRTGYLSFHTGGAITNASEVEKEYEECLVKAEAILKVFGTSLED